MSQTGKIDSEIEYVKNLVYTNYDNFFCSVILEKFMFLEYLLQTFFMCVVIVSETKIQTWIQIQSQILVEILAYFCCVINND